MKFVKPLRILPLLVTTGLLAVAMVSGADEEKVSDIAHVGAERPWQPPSYADQATALGYGPETFTVPTKMRARVDFWKDIYTKFDTNGGVLHDSQHVGLVYETVDFTPIENDISLDQRHKSKARRKLVDDKKKEIASRLLRLSKLKNADGLTGDDLRYWKMFESITEPDKFVVASRKGRLRFQLGQKDKFIKGIFYSGRYIAQMEKIFRDEGLPIELTRLPFVESSFNVKARSKVGASGIWQFMRYTGRRFLRISPAADERNDPVRATRAAARLLRMNYNMLNKWPLAVTAYNHGAAGVARMVKKVGTDDISELVDERRGRFGFASANFYASFLAALEVEKNAKQLLGDVVWDAPLNAVELDVTKTVSKRIILGWFGGNEELAKEMNPHLSANFWRGYARLQNKDRVWVPKDKMQIAQAGLEKLPRHSRDTIDGVNYYMISPGETLSGIAATLGTSVRSLVEFNEIENPRGIRPGQKLRIPK